MDKQKEFEGMKIDYVIISSDDNSMYKDFYPIVSEMWKNFGYKTYYINITDYDDIVENEFGVIHKIKKLNFVTTSFQSQVVRLFASKLIENLNILTSDIDMLPINGEYYKQFLVNLTEKNIIGYSGQPYGNVPYYPMCYILSNSNNLRQTLQIDNFNFSEYCQFLYEKYGDVWNCDEQFLYEKINQNSDKLLLYTRNIKSTRIDRSDWVYNLEKLKNGYYIDSHLLRPYTKYKQEIDKLCEDIKNNL